MTRGLRTTGPSLSKRIVRAPSLSEIKSDEKKARCAQKIKCCLCWRAYTSQCQPATSCRHTSTVALPVCRPGHFEGGAGPGGRRSADPRFDSRPLVALLKSLV